MSQREEMRRVALVTGAAMGIGRAVATELARAGYTVFAADIDAANCQRVAAEINAAGGDAQAIDLDVGDAAAWARAKRTIADKYGYLDTLVNNAGILVLGDIENATAEDWRRIRRVNLDSIHLGATTFLPLLQRAPNGVIVNLSSTDAVNGSQVGPIYSATKGVVRRFSELLATECSQGDSRVRVYSVLPGPIETPLMDGAARQLVRGDDPIRALMRRMILRTWKKQVRRQVPRARLGAAVDIAQGVVFLASNPRALANGASLVIDGGFSSA